MKRCKICGREAYVLLKSPKMALCREHYREYFERKVSRTLNRYHMLNHANRLLVALSGGKDSLAVALSLNSLGYDFECLHINLGIKEYSDLSEEISRKQCEALGKKLHIVDLRSVIGHGIGDVRTKRSVCSYCGMTKRYIMNKFAWDNGYDVVITGHNLDDESTFLLSNLLHWNVEFLARQGPVLPEGNKLVRKIKPLYELTGYEIEKYVEIFEIDYVRRKCPYSGGAKSIEYKRSLDMIEEVSPGTKINFIRGFVKNRNLFPAQDVELKECKVCGMPTTTDICAFCRFWKMDREIKFKLL